MQWIRVIWDLLNKQTLFQLLQTAGNNIDEWILKPFHKISLLYIDQITWQNPNNLLRSDLYSLPFL